MEVTITQAQKRAGRIDAVQKSIQLALDNNRDIEWRKLSIIMCEQFACSQRTAAEYISVARVRLKI
jgi:hypothetical protein